MDLFLNYASIGKRIRKSREDKGITQEILGELCSLSTSYIGHIERGTRKPSLETLFKIAVILDVSLDWLVFDSVDSTNITFSQISSILKTKSKDKVEVFMNVVRILAEKIDDL